MDNEQITNQITDRILYLSGDIDNCNIAKIAEQILKIIEMDRHGMATYCNYKLIPIQLNIQSFGGSINDMWALIDIIETSTTPIITICSGYCMSAASLIFMAGHARYMYKHSSLMLHQMSVFNGGKMNDFKLDEKNFEKMHKRIMKYIKKHTKLGKKFFKRFDKAKEDVYLSAKKCLKYEICDEIIDPSDIREELLSVLSGK